MHAERLGGGGGAGAHIHKDIIFNLPWGNLIQLESHGLNLRRNANGRALAYVCVALPLPLPLRSCKLLHECVRRAQVVQFPAAETGLQ